METGEGIVPGSSLKGWRIAGDMTTQLPTTRIFFNVPELSDSLRCESEEVFLFGREPDERPTKPNFERTVPCDSRMARLQRRRRTTHGRHGHLSPLSHRPAWKLRQTSSVFIAFIALAAFADFCVCRDCCLYCTVQHTTCLLYCTGIIL